MLDIAWVRQRPAAFDAGLARRGKPALSGTILALDERRRAAQTELQTAQARRNDASRQIGAVKKQGGDAQPLMDEVAAIKARMAELEAEEQAIAADLDALLLGTPNLPAADVPDGLDENANVEIRRWGTPGDFPFTPLEHDAIGPGLGMDFDTAGKLCGARFTLLRGDIARLARALGQFMLDLHIDQHGYTEVNTPVLVRDEALFGTGQLPKFAEDLFHTEQGHWLIPTAEVTLTNTVADAIVEEKALPIRLTALTQCFRSEAGAAGKDTRGMIRQHQFEKVEMVAITTPDQSDAEHQRMTANAEQVLQRLGLPYRVMALCAGDMGFSAQRTFDLEVWLPGQGRYREISSVSNCGDFQARRMKARYRPEGEKGARAVHTLNGSGVAVGRALVAVLENYQQADGSVVVPEALRPYMGGRDILRPQGAA